MPMRSWLRSTLFLAPLFALLVGDAGAACVPPPSGLVGWWRGQNNGLESVTGNHGNVGTTTFAAGQVGQGFNFVPPAGVTIPASASYNPQSPGFTAEFWMKGIHNQPDGDATVFEKSHGGNAGWAFQMNAATGIMRLAMGNGSTFVEITATGDVLDGVFHHVAGTWDGTTLRLYVDAVLKSSAGITTPAPNSGTLNIGYWWAGSRRFRGVIDEASLYDRALSLAELQSIVTAGSDGKCTACGNGVIDFDEICEDGNVIGGDCCSPTCEPEPPATPCADDGVACTLDYCSSTGRCLHASDGSCPCVAPPSDIVSWWRAEGSASDSVGGNHGTLQSPATYAAGKVSQAFDFNAGGYVAVNHDANLNLGPSGFTAEFWMQGSHDQPGSLFVALDKGHSQTFGTGWVFQGTSSNGQVVFGAFIAPNNFVSVTSSIDLLDGTFHHVAGTWNGSTITMYVDGEPYESKPLTAPVANLDAVRIGDFLFGGRRLKGLVDEVTIYDRALSTAELASIFTAGGAGKCAPCGDGIVDAGEQCDDDNVASGDCCGASCQFESNGSPCATDGNACTDDQCDGAGACTHPANVAPCSDGIFCNGVDVCAGGVCTHPGDPCTGGPECNDTCDEGADTCAEPFGTPCASDGSVCSIDECDGAGACAHMPGNTGVECRGAAGVCDLAEVCDGANVACPTDAKSVASCRPATGDCDAPEVCDGAADACPADLAIPDGTTCSDGNGCTIADACAAGVCMGNPMTCGDGTLQGSCAEECDDGNLTPEDGCGATCQLEPCGPTPETGCRQPTVVGKASLKLKNSATNEKDQLQWKWGSGAATALADFGDPTTTETYHLCVYDNGVLRSSTRIPAGGTCSGKPCWKAGTHGFQYKSKDLTPDGAAQLKLKEGVAGKAQIQLKGKGALLEMPGTGALVGPVIVQLKQASEAVCWEATFSVPFGKNDGASFGDKSD